MKRYLYFGILSILSFPLFAQEFTRQDTLRGSITPERAWWDLIHYELSVTIDTANRSITGSNTITYLVRDAATEMQIDLQAPLIITKVMQKEQILKVRDEGNAHFIRLEADQPIGSEQQITIFYEGVPQVAKRAPWDGGFTWSKDANGVPFIATSNQGIGASIWWPCKDHPADEPDKGITEHFTVPKNLVAVGNGRLIKTKSGKGTKTYTWNVSSPINDYGVNLNVGDYKEFHEYFGGEKGKLDMTYYVLSYNLDRAREHFQDAKRTMEAFEYWFGPYPFYEDGYKLVEVPYLGMEHQSSVTYGNNFQKGYLGRDLSLTGHGLKWDYIIVHETGHEWFANNITYQDIADMWIHESFTCYSEGLFTEYFYGKHIADEYIRGMRHGIRNQKPMIGKYGLNNEGDDLYNKGSNMLHTLRQWIDDDSKWRSILRDLNRDFYHQTVSSGDIENYIAEKSGLNLEKFFDQDLRDTRIPVLEYFVYNGKLMYRWSNCVSGFDMPIKATIDGNPILLTPKSNWNFRNMDIQVSDVNTLKLDPNYYVYSSWITKNP